MRGICLCKIFYKFFFQLVGSRTHPRRQENRWRTPLPNVICMCRDLRIAKPVNTTQLVGSLGSFVLFYVFYFIIWLSSAHKVTHPDWLRGRAMRFSYGPASFGGKISELICRPKNQIQVRFIRDLQQQTTKNY